MVQMPISDNPSLTKKTLLDQSTAVRTGMLAEVRDVCNKIKPNYDGVRKYSTSIKDWLLPIIDLREYHVYPISGITEGLNWWYDKETRTVDVAQGDYQWIIKTGSDVRYVSMPSAIDGNLHTINDDRPIVLDLAYVGSTPYIQISNRSVEKAFYSLSKPFGIRNIRTGWYFSKTADERLDSLIHNAKYFNYYACDVAEAVINQFKIGHVYNRLHTQQSSICDLFGLTPSDSVWLATSTDDEYTKFRRQCNIARICLAGLYDYAAKEI